MTNEPPRRPRPSGNSPGNTNLLGNQHGNDQGGRNNGGNNNGYGGAGGGQGGSEQIRDILHVIFKRKRLIAVVFLVIVLPALLATALRKPTYVATAKVEISTQRTDPTMQPTDLTRLETIQLNESLVNSEVHVISSRDLLEQVVLKLAPSRDGGAPSRDGAKGPLFGEQILALSQNLAVTPIKASNVIQIDYKASDPMVATRMVNRVVDEYLAYHATVHGNKGLSRFYDEQGHLLQQESRKADDALVNFAESEGIVSPKDEIEATVRMVGEVSSALRDVTTSISGTEERIRAVRDQLATQPEVVKRSQYLEVNPVVSQLGAQLVDREVDRVTLLRKYTEKDRHVRDNADEIADLRAQMDTEMRERPTIVAHQLYRANPIREERLHMLLDLESQLREMRAREASLDEELSRVNRRLVGMQQKSIEFDRLQQEVKNRRDTYELYVKREQEARISQAMDEQKLVNVDVVQRPALPLARADLQRVSTAVAMIAGLVIGLAAAFAREFMSPTLHSEWDVGRHLGLPLMASIAETAKA
jgi:succinoglycan biosynthesis transport protein ExoP